MAKSIYLTDEQYRKVTEAAQKSGFRVQRGRGGQLALFVTVAATACTGLGLQPPAKSTAEVSSPAKARGKHQPRQ